MKVINDIKSFILSAFYSGKAYKASSRRCFDKALEYHEIVLKNTKDINDPLIPLIYQDVAKILCELKRYDEALEKAYMSLEIYSKVEKPNYDILNSIHELKALIAKIQKRKIAHTTRRST